MIRMYVCANYDGTSWRSSNFKVTIWKGWERFKASRLCILCLYSASSVWVANPLWVSTFLHSFLSLTSSLLNIEMYKMLWLIQLCKYVKQFIIKTFQNSLIWKHWDTIESVCLTVVIRIFSYLIWQKCNVSIRRFHLDFLYISLFFNIWHWIRQLDKVWFCVPVSWHVLCYLYYHH